MIKNNLQVLFLSFLILGCSTPIEKKQEVQQAVFYEIFPLIIDTLHTDLRVYPYEIANDTKKLDSIAKDTTAIIIVLNDTLELLNKRDYVSLQNYLRTSSIALDSVIEDSIRIIDVARLRAKDKRIRFKTVDSFPKGTNFWTAHHDFHLSAKFSFSRILLSINRTHGVLHVGYVCGRYNCGEGFLVYIKKESGKWQIDRIEEKWAM